MQNKSIFFFRTTKICNFQMSNCSDKTRPYYPLGP
jgi:hypothetical protein